MRIKQFFIVKIILQCSMLVSESLVGAVAAAAAMWSQTCTSVKFLLFFATNKNLKIRIAKKKNVILTNLGTMVWQRVKSSSKADQDGNDGDPKSSNDSASQSHLERSQQRRWEARNSSENKSKCLEFCRSTIFFLKDWNFRKEVVLSNYFQHLQFRRTLWSWPQQW